MKSVFVKPTLQVEIFDTPSGSIRGFMTDFLDVKKGKKTVEKRVLHAHIYQDEPLDCIHVSLPTRMSPDEVRAAASKMIAFANEVEVQYACRHAPITYRGILDAYERILKANPSKALRICETSDKAVAFMADGGVIQGYLHENGSVYYNTAIDFDKSAWITEEGRWDSDESHAVTMKFVNEPQLVDYKLVLV
jgi:hypothetical protein